jgi:hypothetical protein
VLSRRLLATPLPASARRYNVAGFVVGAAGVMATIGAVLPWYTPARYLVAPDFSGVGLSGGAVLVATVGMAALGVDIALSNRVPAAILAAAAGVIIVVAAYTVTQHVTALRQDPTSVEYTLDAGLWLTAIAGALGLLGATASLIRRFRT